MTPVVIGLLIIIADFFTCWAVMTIYDWLQR
jgi:hypothetical protein